MSGMINIGGSEDPEYRYKMPRVVTKVEGSGNGIKTVLPNLQDVADALKRPPNHPLKFCGIELGALTIYDEKNEKCIVNGQHSTEDIQRLIHQYVDKFVLCPKCKLPETDLRVKTKKGEIYHRCGACGARSMVDLSHKLTSVILKDAREEERKKKRKDKDGKKKGEKKDDKEDGEKKKKDDKKKKKKKVKKEETKEAVESAPEDDEIIATDVTPSTESDKGNNAETLNACIRSMTLFLKGTPPPETEAVVSQVTALQQTYRMTREMRVTIFVRAAFSSDPVALTKDDDSDLMASLSSVVDSVGSAPLAQEALLDSFSTLLFDAGKIGFAPLVFKNLFDAELIDEENALEWEKGTSSVEAVKAAKAKSAIFFKWLREAAEESSSDEEEEAEKPEE